MTTGVDASSTRWDAVRQRLDAVTQALDAMHATSDEGTRDVLAARARALAQPVAPPDARDVTDVVTFRLAGETYGIAAMEVLEVVRLAEFTPLPGAEPPATALTAWRGELLILLDLRRGLGLSTTALNDLRQVVIVTTTAGAAGVLVDEVIGMARIHADELELSAVERMPRPYARGVSRDAVILLDPARFAPGDTLENP